MNLDVFLMLNYVGVYDIAFKFVSAVPEPIILPVICNDDNDIDAPETNKFVKMVLSITSLILHLNYSSIMLGLMINIFFITDK
jgi:hypothetical protein